MKSRISHILGQCPTTELHTDSRFHFFFLGKSKKPKYTYFLRAVVSSEPIFLTI